MKMMLSMPSTVDAQHELERSQGVEGDPGLRIRREFKY
jgi:hypothetical protein